MPATLPPPTPTPVPETSADYFGEPSAISQHQHVDTASPHATAQSQVKRCYQCRSPLSSDSNMTFHIELFEGDGMGGGVSRQEQICARCVIRGGILGNVGEDGMAVQEDDVNADNEIGMEIDDRTRCSSRLDGLEQDSVDGAVDGEPNVHLVDSIVHQDHPPFTPPHSPNPIDNVEAGGSRRSSFDLRRQDAFAGGSGSSSTTGAPSPPPAAQVCSSLPTNYGEYHAGPSTNQHTPPRTPSPQNTDDGLYAAHAVDTIFEEPASRPEIAKARKVVLPDLYTDITHLKRRSDGRGCLYPGSVFSGTQRSGRNSYDVTVTIVDVSFAEATLTGYLLIHNLTPSHPRLTTLFTADIIGGPHHGFHTGQWGATEEDDLTHWSRFRGFSGLKKELRGPRGIVDSRERNCVFMRWKERFLVPDHRVRDINGASFAGFYYVCVDFDPTTPSDNSSSLTYPSSSQHSLTQSRLPPTPRAHTAAAPSGGRSRAATLMADVKSFDWTTHEREKVEAMERARGKGYGTAQMEGLYFHQNSEPYQHLSLRHIPERTSATFEFR
ncbi:hypothetical protein CALCODRAFT_497411 [Calocera cornea HHB12733]|uniref:Vacuolar import and degradation protein n=1 Tax=Calocera cornea HHB12733 TaxID=1353952 RepID=A0A165F8D9_9BASI|nr:hypothetical protein CALCODRAFT_497411 [Calocera cornea HHB12733]